MNSKSDSDYLIEKLHDFCLEAFESALSQAGPLSTSVSKQLRQEWQQERGRFVLWGDGAAVRGGELDVRLRDSKEHELHESVVIVLTTMAYTLSSAEGKGNFQNLLAAANHFVPEIAEFIGSEELELKPDELIIEIKESNDSLYDLVPFLGELIESDFKAADLDESPQTSYPGEKVYERNILDKFPALDKTFAESLAQINWIRHVRIRDMALAHQVEGDACSESESDFSSTVPSTVLSSIFDDNDDDSYSAASVSSFTTSVAEESGQARIPLPPVPLEHGVEFQCNICFKMQYKIYNKFQWKKHVLQDLQPYSCIAEMCTERGITYGSRRGWVAHEFLHHRCFSEWHCIGDCGRSFSERREFVAHILEDHLKSSNSGINIDEIVDSREQKSAYSPPRAINCPFCLEQIEETKRTFQKHVGRHFDEIALKTLPPEVFDVQNEELGILKDNELSDSDNCTRRSSFSSSDEPVGIENMTAQAVGTGEGHNIMVRDDAESSRRDDSVQVKLNPDRKSATVRQVPGEEAEQKRQEHSHATPANDSVDSNSDSFPKYTGKRGRNSGQLEEELKEAIKKLKAEVEHWRNIVVHPAPGSRWAPLRDGSSSNEWYSLFPDSKPDPEDVSQSAPIILQSETDVSGDNEWFSYLPDSKPDPKDVSQSAATSLQSEASQSFHDNTELPETSPHFHSTSKDQKRSSTSGIRKRSTPLPPIVVEDPLDTVAMRRARNTLAARKSRAKKAEKMDEMEDMIKRLKAEAEHWKIIALGRL